MEPIDTGVDSPSLSQGSPRGEVAGIETAPNELVVMTASDASSERLGELDEKKALKDGEAKGTTAASWTVVDASTPVTNIYLTFDTELPTVNHPAALRSTDLPKCPDLRKYGDPTKMANTKKNIMLVLSCIATCLTAYTAGSYSPPATLLAEDFGVSRTAVLCGITLFTVGFAIAPMVLAPLSETNGRYPVFVVSGIIFVIFQAVCGVVTNLGGMLIARFLCGVGGSVFSTMVGGVIADLWVKEERNTPMALYSGAVLVGTGLGPLDASLMVFRWSGEGITGVGAKWRWVFWHQAILDAALVLALTVLFNESRGSVLLSRKAQKLNQWYEALEAKGAFGVWIRDAPDGRAVMAAGDRSGPTDVEKAASPMGASVEDLVGQGFKLQRIRWLVKEDEQRASLFTMITVSLVRPFHLLFTEPAVFFFSLWVSFAWAVLYLTFGSIPLVFANQYGFNQEQTGYVFISMIVGSILATAIGVYQESLLKHPKWQRKAGNGGGPTDAPQTRSDRFWAFMRRRFPSEAPESRLYFTCVSGILLPAGLYLFGFGARPDIHWIVPAIAITLATMGIFFVYLATFNYLADSYHAYASSALAAQSFCRNMLAGAFPLVVTPLFDNLGDSAAGGLLGAIATALTAVPWALAIFGERIRRRSKFAVSLEHED
ncbi:major facilitator superfamily domain-containing protein [Xylariales sp. PMI_506]|nr:major facilitator superfamily domain-containing protein [Xylariales sp. PMI_506]